jgi:hypothetical protein
MEKTMKERLKEILQNHDYYAHCEGCTRVIKACENCRDERLADHLLANGVIVPPVKVGQTVYSVSRKSLDGHWEDNRYIVDRWSEWTIREIKFSLTLWECGGFGENVFATRTEAEIALAEREKYRYE